MRAARARNYLFVCEYIITGTRLPTVYWNKFTYRRMIMLLASPTSILYVYIFIGEMIVTSLMFRGSGRDCRCKLNVARGKVTAADASRPHKCFSCSIDASFIIDYASVVCLPRSIALLCCRLVLESHNRRVYLFGKRSANLRVWRSFPCIYLRNFSSRLRESTGPRKIN